MDRKGLNCKSHGCEVDDAATYLQEFCVCGFACTPTDKSEMLAAPLLPPLPAQPFPSYTFERDLMKLNNYNSMEEFKSLFKITTGKRELLENLIFKKGASEFQKVLKPLQEIEIKMEELQFKNKMHQYRSSGVDTAKHLKAVYDQMHMLLTLVVHLSVSILQIDGNITNDTAASFKQAVAKTINEISKHESSVKCKPPKSSRLSDNRSSNDEKASPTKKQLPTPHGKKLRRVVTVPNSYSDENTIKKAKRSHDLAKVKFSNSKKGLNIGQCTNEEEGPSPKKKCITPSAASDEYITNGMKQLELQVTLSNASIPQQGSTSWAASSTQGNVSLSDHFYKSAKHI